MTFVGSGMTVGASDVKSLMPSVYSAAANFFSGSHVPPKAVSRIASRIVLVFAASQICRCDVHAVRLAQPVLEVRRAVEVAAEQRKVGRREERC